MAPQHPFPCGTPNFESSLRKGGDQLKVHHRPSGAQGDADQAGGIPAFAGARIEWLGGPVRVFVERFKIPAPA